MFNHRTFAVFKRELKSQIMSKRFVIMTIIFPLVMFGLMMLPGLMMKINKPEKAELVVISENPVLIPSLKAEFDSTQYVKNDQYIIQYKSLDSLEFQEYYNHTQNELISGALSGMIFIPEEVISTKEIKYYSLNPKNRILLSRLGSVINRVVTTEYFADKDISEKDIAYVRKNVDFRTFRVSEKEEAQEEGEGNLILSFVFTFLLYLSLIFMGQNAAQSVLEEKKNRVVEILLSSVNSNELMTGKILGVSITALLQMTIWIIPIIFLSLNVFITLPREYWVDISLGNIFYYLLNFLVGVITFLAMFASVGSIFDNEKDAQSGYWMVLILIVIPFHVAIFNGIDPGNSIAEICSFIPYFSIMVMPSRLAIEHVPIWQLTVAFIINVVTLFGTIYLCARIYRIGILMTGKKPKWSEVIRWVKYKY